MSHGTLSIVTIINFTTYSVFHGVIKVKFHDGMPHDPASGKIETVLLFLSRIHDDERSLGLTGISWVRKFLINVYNWLCFDLPDGLFKL